MAKDKEKESEKSKKKLQKARPWSLSGLTGSNSVSRSPSGDATLEYMRAKYFKISIENLKNPQFRSMLQMSEDTIVLDRDNRFKLLGAQNLNGITCFLNATLFAMFCRSDSCFDTLLYSAFEGPVGRFAIMVRLWVNMLRSGWFISSDVVAQLRENLAQCGWEVARMDQQQDASECYIHIVEYLKLPKSTLQASVAHGGKSDVESDFKFETEYLLDCSIPDKPPGQAILLEECLADYFTNIVQVRRQLATTPGDQTPSINYWTKPNLNPSSSYSASSGAPPPYVGDGNGYYGGDEKAKLKSGIQTQERNVAAWQFFKLLPYYVPTSGISETAVYLANRKPMLGICLKRYGYDTRRQEPYRNGRTICIPKYIELSNFVTHDEDKLGSEQQKKYQLVFYSTVCHRGQYVQSGHYVSVVYDAQNERWLHFDDIAAEKITSSSPEYLLAMETPYMIFYQLEEVGDTGLRTPGIHVPPSYPIPEIPPPPTRPPPPIPQTSFVSKETNQSPPSPGREFQESAPPSYPYSELASTSAISMNPPDRISPAPPTMNPPPPPSPPYSIPLPPLRPPSPNHGPPLPPLITYQPPSQPTHPPPPPPDFIDMPASPPIPHQSLSQGPTPPPMPLYPPPVPPLLSPIHASGSNGTSSTYPYTMTAEPLNMPEAPAFSPQGGKLFQMDDDEDLYGETPHGEGKVADREGPKNDNCLLQ